MIIQLFDGNYNQMTLIKDSKRSILKTLIEILKHKKLKGWNINRKRRGFLLTNRGQLLYYKLKG